ncbi:MAG: SAM-dependent methyltransferase [Gammaproteobacteria bacterium]|nr:SAM-dependent methyltransferase [Gammaproteobacteria bacterium]
MFHEPDQEQVQHSSMLRDVIAGEIKANGNWMGFDRYMELALYAPGLGYYSAGPVKFGHAGDFVTAPLMGPLFARCMARQCGEILRTMKHADGRVIVEYGAGTGEFSRDFLQAAEETGSLPDEYWIIEPSPDLRARQQRTIEQATPVCADRVFWRTDLPGDGVSGVIIANELLDAMPVTRFEVDPQGQPREIGVMHGENGFEWAVSENRLPASWSDRLSRYALPAGYRSEIGYCAEAWVRTVGEKLNTGVVLLCDYGFPQREYYHPDRNDGTLMCHYRHVAHPDPFFYPGIQDISVHIDFTAIQQAGQSAALETIGYTTQSSFLLSLGVLDELQHDGNPTRETLGVAQEIKKLTLPHEMGELFKVIAFGKNHDRDLRGFAMHNRIGRL